jgi:hypothetical protein
MKLICYNMTMFKKCDDYFLFDNTIFIINIVIFIRISLTIIIVVIQPPKSVIFAIIFSQFSIHFFLFFTFFKFTSTIFSQKFFQYNKNCTKNITIKYIQSKIQKIKRYFYFYYIISSQFYILFLLLLLIEMSARIDRVYAAYSPSKMDIKLTETA